MAERKPERREEGGVATEIDRRVKTPSLYKVVLHNDDYTTQEFVVFVLESIFHLPEQQAFAIMMHVHTRGTGVAGLFPYEVAEAKAGAVMSLAKQHEYPLKCTVEEE